MKSTDQRVRGRRRGVCGVAVLALLVGLITGHGRLDAAELKPSAAALAQIHALLEDKEARTPALRKIDSQLIYAARMARGEAAAAGVVTLETGVDVDPDGLVAVEIRATPSTRLSLLIKRLGGQVIRSFAFADAIEANLPIDQLEVLAADDDVRFIVPPAQGITARAKSTMPTTASTLELTPRLQRFRATLEKALAAKAAADVAHPRPDIGTVTSQGDVTHAADVARSTHALTGAGVRIGVLSDSLNKVGSQGSDVANGNLPGIGNPNGYLTPVRLAGSGEGAAGVDEGRAMLQIVHDLAPGAELYFASASASIADFANNIRALGGIATSAPPNGNVSPGCHIIIDDIFYFVESGLHDGQVGSSTHNMALLSQAVNDVVANGALYFSSAGNFGSLTQGSAGAWEGDFVAGALPGLIAGGGDALAWNGSDVGNATTSAAGPITLQWSDPIGASTNDYDLFRLNSTMTSILSSSTNVQTGSQDPFEQTPSAATGKLVVVRRAGAASRFLSLSSNRGKLTYATTGQTRGHAAVASAFGVAATPAVGSFGAPTPPGPFPGVFVASNQVEPFSSDGPRRSFFAADGSAITPGNFLAATDGGVLRQKPDFTAADGVAAGAPGGGFNPFFGTSAAAPHAGAIAALLKQASPLATPAQISAALTSSALDIMAAGADRDSGAGILRAPQAVAALGVAPIAFTNLGPVSVTSGNNRIDPNDCNTVSVAIRNDGSVAATAVSATLSTTTPGVTVTQATASYGPIAAGASASATFQVSTDASVVDGGSIAFTLTMDVSGGPSPRVATFTLPLGADAGNYVFTATPTGASIPSGGAMVFNSRDDDRIVTNTTPFAFSVYGVPVAAGQTISLSTNGNIQFVASGASIAFENASLPTGVLANAPAINPYWDDLTLEVSGGGIFTHVLGAAPQRQYVIEWRGRHLADGPSGIVLRFAAIFTEGTNLFRLVYVATGTGPTAQGGSATVGAQAGAAGSDRSVAYSVDSPDITAGLQLAATPSPGTPGNGACALVDRIFTSGFDVP